MHLQNVIKKNNNYKLQFSSSFSRLNQQAQHRDPETDFNKLISFFKYYKQNKKVVLLTERFCRNQRKKRKEKNKKVRNLGLQREISIFRIGDDTSSFVVVVHLLSHIQLVVTPWTTAFEASWSFTISLSLLKLMSIESVMLSNHFILCCPLLLLPSIFPSIRVFSNESVLHIRWPRYWSFNFSIGPSNGYSGLISFRMDLLGSPCSPGDSQESSSTPQFKSINSSVLSCLYSPTLTSIHDYWKNHSFDQTDFYRQNNVSAFYT